MSVGFRRNRIAFRKLRDISERRESDRPGEAQSRMETRSGIAISSLDHLPRALEQFRPGAVVSILSRAEAERLPPGMFGPRKVLRMAFDDLGHSSGQFRAPHRADIEALIGFVKDWAGTGTILIHCRAGASRSPAAALIVAATVWPDRPEFLGRIARAKSYFTPNSTMLRLGDEVLGTNLVGLVRELPPPGRQDQWSPVFVPVAP